MRVLQLATLFTPLFFFFFFFCRCLLQNEMLDSIVLHHMRSITQDPSVTVRSAVTQHLVSLAKACTSSHFEKLVHIIYRVRICLLFDFCHLFRRCYELVAYFIYQGVLWLLHCFLVPHFQVLVLVQNCLRC